MEDEKKFPNVKFLNLILNSNSDEVEETIETICTHDHSWVASHYVPVL